MDLNKITVSGRLGKDPEIRFSQGGTDIATFSLGVNSSFKKDAPPIWPSCTAFGKTAQIIAACLKKGSWVIVSGRLDIQKWQDSNTGQNREKAVIIVDSVVLGPKQKQDGQSDDQGYDPIPRGQNSHSAPTTDFDMGGDDIPF